MSLTIAMSMRVVKSASYLEARDAISHDWIKVIRDQGWVPLLVPNLAEDADYIIERFQPDAVLLTGGNDLVPPYDRESDVSWERNIFEGCLINAAIRQGIPILGICRGLQMINMHFGGEVVPNGKNRSHVGTVHDLIWRAPFDSYEGRPDRVNSFHDLIVKPEGLASCLDIAALSLEDGNVEGAAHQEIPVFCIQWHPERPQPSGAQFEMGLIERMVRGGNFWT